MNAKDNNLDDEFDAQNSDMHNELGEFSDDQFDDYDLNESEEGLTEDHSNSTDPQVPDAAREPIDTLPEAAPSKKGIVDLLKENWIFVVIGVCVVGFVGYMISTVMTPNTPPPAPKAPQTQGSFPLPQQQAAAAAASAAAATGSANGNPQLPSPNATIDQQGAVSPIPVAQSPLPPPQNSVVMSQDDMKTLLQGFQQMVQKNSQSIEQSLQTITDNTNQANTNEQAINDMQKQFSGLAQQIKSYNQNIAAVNNRLDTLQAQLTSLVAEQTANIQKLTLRAIVPGRAWLIDSQGRTISVTEGTQIGNFGLVTKIDDKKGEVDTSSGYIFK